MVRAKHFLCQLGLCLLKKLYRPKRYTITFFLSNYNMRSCKINFFLKIIALKTSREMFVSLLQFKCLTDNFFQMYPIRYLQN